MSLGRWMVRISVAVAGGLTVLIGIILIPLPGAGILVVFAGLAILSREFEFAKRWNAWLKSKYYELKAWAKHRRKDLVEAMEGWIARRNVAVKSVMSIVTAMLIVAIIWLVNGLGEINQIFGLGWDWMETPIPYFR